MKDFCQRHIDLKRDGPSSSSSSTSGRGGLMPCLDQQTPARLHRLTTDEGTRTEETTGGSWFHVCRLADEALP